MIGWMFELAFSLGVLQPTPKERARLRRRLAALVTPRAPRARRPRK
jgi:hypothetical protein